MPELPEVETIKRDLHEKLTGRTIQNVVIYDKRVIGQKNLANFSKNLIGQTMADVTRRSKALIIHFKSGTYLIVHLKMTGQLIYGEDLKKTKGSNDTKVVMKLSDGKFLNYNDQRTFGKLWVVKDLNEVNYLKTAGPEPLNGSFTLDWLKVNTKTRNVPIKTLLMNQTFLAGIGNIYASEILFESKINPRKKALRLSTKEIKSLYQATRDILEKAILHRGTSMRNYRDAAGEKGKFSELIKVYGKEGENCPSCRNLIQRIVQAGRSTFFCKICQK